MKCASPMVIVVAFGFALLSMTAYAGDKRISSAGYFGCTSQDYYETLVGYAAQKDMASFKQGLETGMLTNQCITFYDGEVVFFADTETFPELVKVRRERSMTEYWTNSGAIK